MKTDELRETDTEKDREALVRCATDAFEALKLIPGIDPNGPLLVWLSEHLFELYRKEASAAAR